MHPLAEGARKAELRPLQIFAEAGELAEDEVGARAEAAHELRFLLGELERSSGLFTLLSASTHPKFAAG